MIEPVPSILKLAAVAICMFFMRDASIPAPLSAIILWVILTYLGTNLLSYVVRGLAHQGLPLEDDFEDEYERGEARRLRRCDTVMTAVWALLSIGYFCLLVRWWNLTVAFAAFAIILARLPSLLFELRTGLSYSAEARLASAMSMASGFRLFSSIMQWAALPILWWGLSKG